MTVTEKTCLTLDIDHRHTHTAEIFPPSACKDIKTRWAVTSISTSPSWRFTGTYTREEQPFGCEKKYTHMASMQLHLKVNKVQQHHSYGACGRSFTWHTELKYHQCTCPEHTINSLLGPEGLVFSEGHTEVQTGH